MRSNDEYKILRKHILQQQYFQVLPPSSLHPPHQNVTDYYSAFACASPPSSGHRKDSVVVPRKHSFENYDHNLLFIYFIYSVL